MSKQEGEPMADKEHRAILTSREKEILRGEADVSKSYYYRVVTRVRNKINTLPDDLEVLDKEHDTLGEELREAVCENHIAPGDE